MKRFLACTLFILVGEFYCPAQQQIYYQIDSIVSKTYNEVELPGIVVSFVMKEGTAFTIAKGYADVDAELPMTENTLLHGGSTGKTFVSAISIQLMSEGKFSLDDKISTYLGNYDWFSRLPNSETITVRHLMQHTSGIQRYEFKEEFVLEVTKDASRIWQPEELISYVLDDEPLFIAGEGFSYADTNYILLAMLIEEVTGIAYYDLLKSRILSTIDFNSFETTDQKKIEGMAQGYVGPNDPLGFDSLFLDAKGYPNNNMQFEWAGGGLVYKTKAYAKWLKYLYEGNVFDMQKWEDEYFDGVEATGVGGQYGLGVQIYDVPGVGRLYGHSGFFPGYFTIGFYHPSTGRSIAIQINTSQAKYLRPVYMSFMQMVGVLANQ